MTPTGLDWQPARIRWAHNKECIRHLLKGEPTDLINKKRLSRIVEVREIQPTKNILEFAAMIGCDAERYFEVKGIPFKRYCEHEILTD